MKTTIVDAKVRAIRSSWTAEMAKDLSSYHGIDADKASYKPQQLLELTRVLRAEWRKIKAARILGIK